MTVAFDTLETTKRLTDAGVQREQAEAIAFAIKSGQGDLATKADIQRLEETTKADIQRLEETTKADIQRLEETIQRLEVKTSADIQRLDEKLEDKMDKLEDRINSLRWTMILVVGVAVALLKFLP